MMDEQNQTEYKPTPKEEKLLEVLLNPENRMKSVIDICKIANCARVTYYAAFAKSEFVALYNQKSKELVKQSVGPVLNTFIRMAQRGSFPHGKVVLEMAGIYAERMEHTGKDGAAIEIKNISEDEKLDLIKKVAQKLENN